MLSVEIKVNGCIIGALNVTNRGPVGVTEGERNNTQIWNASLYQWEYLRFPFLTTKAMTLSGETTHDRDNGAEVLLQKVLEQITKAGV